MASLRETQQLLWALITAPEGVAKALAVDADRGGQWRAALTATVRSDDRLSAEERLDIYANMYFYRLLDVLRDDYPAVVALVGDDQFHNLITDYLLHHFPTHFSLRYAGEHLSDFIATQAIARERPYLRELAVFEWSLIDAFDAPDTTALTRGDLENIKPEQWPELCFPLNPAARLFTLEYAVHEVRRSLDCGEKPEPPRFEPTSLCVWRQEHRVRYRTLSSLEWGALQALAGGASFGEACASALDEVDDVEAAQNLAQALASWVEDGLFAAPGDC